MTITALPTPPSRDDPANFTARADAFLGALPTFATEANALAADVNSDAADAAASAAAAIATSGATKWVSGTTYSEGDVVWSPMTYFIYRRKTAGAGTTDPSSDSTNWTLIGGSLTSPLAVIGNSSAGAEIRLPEDTDNGSNYVAIKAPDNIASNATLTAPAVTDTLATIGTTQTFTAAQTFRAANAIRSEAASTQDAVVIAGRAGGTSSYAATITPTTLSASRTITLPNADINFTTGLGVANGGTGTTTLTANNVILGNGTSAVQFVAPGANGNVLTSNGTTWTSAATSASLLGDTDSASPFETSFGYQAGNVNTGVDNTFIGYQAGLANTTGVDNTAIGFKALDVNTTGRNNTAVGSNALGNLTSGQGNTAIGRDALASAGAGQSDDQTAVGDAALQSCTTGTLNTAIGKSALANLVSGSENTAVGIQALNNVSAGTQNIAVGHQSMDGITTGATNTAIGYRSGRTISTGTGNVCVGKEANVSTAAATDQIVIGNAVTGQANTNVTIGNITGKIYNAYTVNATWTQTSDGTMKNIVGPDTLGLSFINRLNPIKYTWKPRNELPVEHPYYSEINRADTTTVIHGFVAQEVKAALDAEGCTTFNGWDQGEDGVQAISREMFISPLVKAVQELSAQLEVLRAEITALKS